MNIPEGCSRLGLELLRLPAGTVEDGLGGMEVAGIPGTVREVLVPKLEETTVPDRAGDWVERLKKTVETTVIVTGPPGSDCVGCGVPSVDLSSTEETEGEGGPVGREPIGEVEDGSLDKVERGRMTEVAEGFTEDPPEALERVTLSPSKSASLRARPECPSSATYPAHQVPMRINVLVYPTRITGPQAYLSMGF